MKRPIAAFGALLILVMGVVPAAAAVPPANDDIDNATAITWLPFTWTGDSTAATTAPDDPDCYGNAATVWYSYTATEAMVLDVWIEGPTTYATTLAVYEGSRGSLSQLSCNDAYTVPYNETFIDLAAGQTVYLMVGSYWGSGGTYTIGARGLPLPPANDDIDNATAIAALPFTERGDSTAATTAPDDPDCYGIAATVWYSYTASEAMVLDVWIEGPTTFGTTLSAYEGSRGSLSQISCNDADYTRWPINEAFISLAAGQTIYLMVGSDGTSGGTYTIGARRMPPPPVNDAIDAATLISSLPFSDGPVDTGSATTDTDPPDPDCLGNGRTVWYRFVAPTDMLIEADTFGSDYDTTLSVYSGTEDTATQLACNDDAGGVQSQVTFEAKAGQTYRFMVGAFGYGPGGTLMFTVTKVAPPTGAIAFERVVEGNSEIFILSATLYANLTNDPSRDFNPSMSPDGKTIVFASDRAGSEDLWLMNADGSNLRRLTSTPDDDSNPGWSPDGSKVTFLRREVSTGNLEVYVMNRNGAGVKNLTRNPAVDAQPSFTPAGDEILFMRNWDIWIMSASGKNQRPIVERSGSDEWPHMVRGRVVFHSTWAGSYDLWSVRASGKDPQRLTFDDYGNEVRPVGSPDGSMIAYQDDGYITTANDDGSNSVTLAPGDFPSWSVDAG